MAEEELKRATAYKVSIGEILAGTFLKADNAPSFLLSQDGRKILRVNLIATLVEILSGTNWILDDGTGTLSVRSFDRLPTCAAGELVLVVGKVREIGAERYVVVEIVRALQDLTWMRLRQAELKQHAPLTQHIALSVTGNSVDSQQIYDSIKKLDSGSGVLISALTEQFGEEAEVYVSRLLEHGEIFEVQPGRVKVLE